MKFYIALLAAMVLASALPAGEIELTRKKAVEMALDKNETYRSVLLEKDRVRGQYLEARAGAFPQLSFDANYLRTIDKQTTVITSTDSSGVESTASLQFGEPHSYTAGLSFYQPLYAAGKVGAAIKIAKYGFALTDEKIKTVRHDIATQVDRAYLGAIAAREAEAVFIEAEQLADSNLSVVELLYQQGQASEYDFLRAQVRASNARPDRIAAQNSSRLALDNLRLLLALPTDTKLLLDPGIDEAVVGDLNLDLLVSEALQNRPEFRQSEQWMKINKKLISIEKGGYKPNIGVSSRMQWDSFQPSFKSSRLKGWTRSWNISLNLNWSIFDGFTTKGKIRQAKVNYNQSRLDNSLLSRQIQLEVQDAVGKVNEAKARVEALGETVAQAERGYQIGQIRYQNGVGTQLELQDAQVALTQTRVNRISALHDLAVAVSSLRRAVGREWNVKW
ncbi:MAG: TolC family protein [candidate division Zixibacteria bacterium]|nr:TolC family protein [candidate division Zixibacteria bacterium]